MHGRYRGGHCCDGCDVRSSLLFGLLVLLAPVFKQFALGEQGLVSELRLVLLADPVPGLVELHCILQDHNFKHFLVWWCWNLHWVTG